MKQRYGCVKGKRVYLMDRATKTERKQGIIKKNQLIVQSLKTGNTATVSKGSVKKISSKFRGKCK